MAYDDANADLEIAAVDELDPADVAVITDGLRAYYVDQAGYYDFRPLAGFLRDSQTGKGVGGVPRRAVFGALFFARVFFARGFCRARIRRPGFSRGGGRGGG